MRNFGKAEDPKEHNFERIENSILCTYSPAIRIHKEVFDPEQPGTHNKSKIVNRNERGNLETGILTLQPQVVSV